MNLLALPVLIPLLAGSLLLLLPNRQLRSLLAFFAAVLVLVCELIILQNVLSGKVLVLQMANWPAPWGISLVADILTGIMLTLSGLTGLLTVLFASSSLQHQAHWGKTKGLNALRERYGFQALLQFLIMGVNMSFLTADLFNLFVAFEVMLIASYGLLLLGNELPQLREGFKYVIVNLIASAIFVVAAGLVYGLVGTLNMADIAFKIAEYTAVQGPDARIRLLAMLLALVFATKSALFPLGFWLPNSYPVPAAAASAFFAAMLTKVGVYSLTRTFTLMFPEETFIKTLLLVLAGLSMLVGALGMITQSRWRHAFAFANVSSVGYLLMGIFTGANAGLAAALYYLIHSVLVIFCLFLIAALAERIAGLKFTLSGHLNTYPYLALAYFIAALALAGLPPTSGFIAKYALIASLLNAGGGLHTGLAIAAVLSGFLLLYAAMKLWRSFFWGEAKVVHKVALPAGMKLITGLSFGLMVLLAVFAGPVYQVSNRAAMQLATNQAYLEAVLVRIDGPRIGDEPKPLEQDGLTEEVN